MMLTIVNFEERELLDQLNEDLLSKLKSCLIQPESLKRGAEIGKGILIHTFYR